MGKAGGRRTKKKKNEGLVICWHTLDEDDSILAPLIDPDFWFNRSSITSLQGFNSPGVKGLLAAVVYRAYMDLSLGVLEDILSAIDFFCSSSTVLDSYVDNSLNFSFICEALNLPKEKIVERLRQEGKLSVPPQLYLTGPEQKAYQQKTLGLVETTQQKIQSQSV